MIEIQTRGLTYPEEVTRNLSQLRQVTYLFESIKNDFATHPQRESFTYYFPTVDEKGREGTQTIEVDKHFHFGVYLTKETLRKQLLDQGLDEEVKIVTESVERRFKK